MFANNSIGEIIIMGHNAEYIYWAYGIVFVVLGFFLWMSARRNN